MFTYDPEKDGYDWHPIFKAFMLNRELDKILKKNFEFKVSWLLKLFSVNKTESIGMTHKNFAKLIQSENCSDLGEISVIGY